MPATKYKDPDGIVDFGVDWSLWLGVTDTISTSTWVVPAGITKTAESNSTTRATIWLRGGTAGEQYRLVNRIVTAGGRTNDQTLVVKVQSR